jgi:Ca2+-binding EF-hand superfamily protein
MHIIMTNHNSTLVSGLRMAAAALTLTGAALAGDPSAGTVAFNTADANTSGGLDLAEFTTTLEEGTSAQKASREFKKADTDKSGLISLSEYLIYIGEIEAPTKEELSFDAADENNDNSISLGEFEDTFTGKQAPIEIFKRFLKADANENEGLSLEEWTLYKKGKAKGPEGAKYYKFDLADRDNNAELTIEEFALTFPQGTKEETIAAKFAKEDENDNLRLTRDEWNPGAPKQSPAL